MTTIRRVSGSEPLGCTIVAADLHVVLEGPGPWELTGPEADLVLMMRPDLFTCDDDGETVEESEP